MVTASQLDNITTILKGQRLEQVAKALDTTCPLYGINTADIFHEFIANVLHESLEFTILEESLNYQAVALTKLFGRHRISIDDCYRYGRVRLKDGSIRPANKVEIANIIYGGSWGKVNLGNINPMDGWVFRGAGPIQTTGRSNVEKFTNYYNTHFNSQHTPESMATLLKTDIQIGVHSACWIFSIAKGLIDEAVNDDMYGIVKKINGGYIGMAERLKYYELAKKYIT